MTMNRCSQRPVDVESAKSLDTNTSLNGFDQGRYWHLYDVIRHHRIGKLLDLTEHVRVLAADILLVDSAFEDVVHSE